MKFFDNVSLRIEKILLVAGLVVLLCGILCWSWFRRFPPEYGFWVSGRNDDYGQLLMQVESVHSSRKPAIVLVGSSAMREAITTPHELKQRVPEYDWHILTAGDLYLVEMAQVVSSLPRDLSGLLLLEISMRLLSTDEDTTQKILYKPRFPTQNWLFSSQMSWLGYTPGMGLGRATFYLSRWNWHQPMHVPNELWDFHQVDHLISEQTEWTRSLAKGESWLNDLPTFVQDNLKLVRMIQNLAPPDIKIRLVQSPRNPQWLKVLNEHPSWSIYQQALQGLEEMNHGRIFRIDTGVDARNYWDHGHIRTLTGRKIATENLFNIVAEAFDEP